MTHRFAALAPRAAAVLFVAALSACGDAAAARQSAMIPPPLDLTEAQRARLTSRRVFFGHQSVGGNIVDGLREVLAADGRLALRVIRAETPASVEGPALIETYLGENGNPASKSAAFVAALSAGAGQPADIAMYKFCYLDVGSGTDVQRVFGDYRASVEQVRAADPRLRIVHFTMPLTARDAVWRRLVKRALRRTTADDLNARRERFNAMMRSAYAGREPLFDLAALESTRPDGSRMFVERGGTKVPSLAPEYTDDGGHLNADARKLIAARLLTFLADL